MPFKRLTWAAWLDRIVVAAVIAGTVAALIHASFGQVPRRAKAYREDMLRQARRVFGWDQARAAVPVLAAQVHQESGWDPAARSRYAAGLTQFTPDTAEWISRLDAELAQPDPLNPAWALRAQAVYMKRLWDSYGDATGEVERWAFALRAYNGGAGWIAKEKRAAQADGANPARNFSSVEHYCGRSMPRRRSASSCQENTEYARRILIARKRKDGGYDVPLIEVYKDFFE